MDYRELTTRSTTQEATLSNSIGGGIAVKRRPGDSKSVVSSHLMTSVGAGGCECIRG